MLFRKAIRRGILFFCLLGGMLAPVLGQDLVVGSNSANVTTNITSGTNAFDNTFIGITVNATNNRLNVLNPGTVLTNSADVFVGYYGSSR